MRFPHPSRPLVAAATGALTLFTLAPQAAAGVRWTAPEGMQLDACLLTAAPWNRVQYGLEVEHADGTVDTKLEQTYAPLEPTSWEIPSDVVMVRWARKIDRPWEFHDHLEVGPDCTFVNGYNKPDPTKPDSVTLAPIWVPVPPTTAAPPTSTTAVPEQTTTTAPFVPQVTTVPTPPVDVFVTTPAPPSSESTTSLPVVELREELPFTGSESAATARLAAAVATVGALFLALSRKLARR